MNILLVSMNRLDVPFPVYPLGLDYVAGALPERHRARILDLCTCPVGAEEPLLLEAMRDFTPGAVGLSIRNIDNTDVAELKSFLLDMRAAVDAIRRVTSAPIILGGAGYTLFPGELLRELGADYGVVGEGERLGQLLDCLASGGGPDEAALLPFVAVRGMSAPTPIAWEGKATLRSPPSLNPSLGHYLARGGMLNLQTKRGCPFRCAYCTYPALEGRSMRLFDPPSLGREAKALEEAGARYIFITDSAFNAHIEHSLEVARQFKAHGLTIPWGGYFAPRRPPDGYYDELKACGLTHAEFGTDVLSESMLVNVGKAFGVQDVFAAQRAARAAGIHTAHFMLLGGPGETIATIDETLDNCEALEGAVLFFFCGMRVYPGTPLFEVAVAEGQISASQNLLEPVFYKPMGLSDEAILSRARARAGGRTHWVVGSGGDKVARLVARMHLRGHIGPLWEKLAP